MTVTTGNPSEAFLRTVVNVSILIGEVSVREVRVELHQFPRTLENGVGFVAERPGATGGLLVDKSTQAWKGICQRVQQDGRVLGKYAYAGGRLVSFYAARHEVVDERSTTWQRVHGR